MDLIITILPVVTKDLPISPRFTPYNFLSRCKFSTLKTRQPMVEFYLLTFPRFPLRKKEHRSYFGKNRTHDFRTSRCAAYLLDHSGDERRCSGDTPVTIEFPTDPGISTSMSLRYIQAVLGFFQNACCITVGRSSPASARVSAPPYLEDCVVNAVRSLASRACAFSAFVIPPPRFKALNAIIDRAISLDKTILS